MTLAEKIAALRGGLGLSQGDLAERLDVSRQSVSKWETGQSVPELDKIVKLADLFGVTVDELVRDGDAPKAEAPPENALAEAPPKEGSAPAAEPETKIVYIERRLARTQAAGVVLLVLGALGFLWGVVTTYAMLSLFGSLLAVLSLPLLLSRRHPFLFEGWLVVGISCLFLNPNTSVTPWGLWGGLRMLYMNFTVREVSSSTLTLGGSTAVVRGVLTLILTFFTARLCWRRWKERKAQPREDGPAPNP